MVHVGYYSYFKIFADEETGLLYLSEDKVQKLAGVVLKKICHYPENCVQPDTLCVGEMHEDIKLLKINYTTSSLQVQLTDNQNISLHLQQIKGITRIPLKECSYRDCLPHFLFDSQNGRNVGIRYEDSLLIGFMKTPLYYDDLNEIRNNPKSRSISVFEGKHYVWFDHFLRGCLAEGKDMSEILNYYISNEYGFCERND